MNGFREKLMERINQIFQDEIRERSIDIEEFTPEFAREQGFSYLGWSVGIRKIREGSKDIRVVIEEPDQDTLQDIISEIDNYEELIEAMVNSAKDILTNPPFSQYISQGVIKASVETPYVKFIPRDEIKQNPPSHSGAQIL